MTLRRCLLLVVALRTLGCSAFVDVDALSDGVCGEREKACNEQCVERSNPRFGCGGVSCAPCAIPNAVPVCSPDLRCAIAVCRPGFEDCDGEVANGCEADIEHDPRFCGSCTARPCVLANATAICALRQCAVRSCEPGWGDCNGLAADGCEQDLRGSDAHCGACARPCASEQRCVAGRCG